MQIDIVVDVKTMKAKDLKAIERAEKDQDCLFTTMIDVAARYAVIDGEKCGYDETVATLEELSVEQVFLLHKQVLQKVFSSAVNPTNSGN